MIWFVRALLFGAQYSISFRSSHNKSGLVAATSNLSVYKISRGANIIVDAKAGFPSLYGPDLPLLS